MDMQDFVLTNTIYHTIVGSTAYGLNTKDSDIDKKGICIKPKEYYFGLKNFEQQEFGKDEVIYSLQKFVKLARDCNPNIIEMLYVDPKFIQVNTEYGERLRANRHLFLSTKAKFTFSGYAFAQLKRIKNHRKWLMFKEVLPKEEDYFKDKVRQTSTGVVHYKKFMEADFDSALRRYSQYEAWKKNRNPERAALEEKYGFDCKHGMHLMRLLRMGQEILETGKVNVLREDREELLELRNGAWEYDKLIEEAEKAEQSLTYLYENSTLQKSPRDKEINKLLVDMTEEFLNDR